MKLDVNQKISHWLLVKINQLSCMIILSIIRVSFWAFHSPLFFSNPLSKNLQLAKGSINIREFHRICPWESLLKMRKRRIFPASENPRKKYQSCNSTKSNQGLNSFLLLSMLNMQWRRKVLAPRLRRASGTRRTDRP